MQHDLSRPKDGPIGITLDTHVTVSPEVILQDIGGESVLLDLRSESYFSLDAVGTRIWHLVGQHGHLQAVHAALFAEYDVESERLEHDLEALIGRLAEAGLVNVETAGAHAA